MVNSNAGYLLNNRYRLVDQIGEGGMANVYLGKDTILNRNVAIKVLRGDLSTDETFVRRFQREALAATALEHPNLVQVYDVGEEKGYHYIVMEYIEGKTLKQLIKQHGPLSVGETIDVMEQLVSAVEHAHSRHVIHRDIKPQNVIVRNDGTVKLTDFGIAIAQNAAQLTQTNSIMGSVHYLAPELAKGQIATIQSDIYSLGILMFELLSGKVPFAGESAVNIALMHMEDKIPSIRKIVGDDVNQAIENIILKATTKNKNLRYNSAHEMLIDLIDCQYRNNEPIFDTSKDKVDDGYTDEKTIIMDKDHINDALDEKLSKKKKIIIGSLVGLLLALGLALFFLFPKEEKIDVQMPDLVNLSKADASDVLDSKNITEEKGFVIKFEDIASEDVEKGKVANTNPVVGTQLTKNQTITIQISSGVQVRVPDVVAMSLSQATDTLEGVGLKVNAVAEQSSQPQNRVLSISPGAGTEVDKGTTITIRYAVTEEVIMLDVRNLTYLNAMTRLQERGFITSTSNCGQDDTVISQSIKPGKSTKVGSTVTLKCEIKKPTETPPPPTDIPADATPEANKE